MPNQLSFSVESKTRTYEFLANLNPRQIERLFRGIPIVKPRKPTFRQNMRMVIDTAQLSADEWHKLNTNGRFLKR